MTGLPMLRTNGEGRPVVSLDIDGTLGDYHGNFLEFAQRYFGRLFPNKLIINPGLPLWEFMGISLRDYRDAKLAYRQGGWKRWMRAYAGASELTRHVRRKLDAELWLCTTRPYLRLDNVDPDTREWLRRNELEFDALLFDPVADGSKYDELLRQAGGRIASVVDDLPEMISEAERLRIPEFAPPILRDQPYNRHVTFARRAMDLDEVLMYIEHDLDLWRKNHG
jgi:hypothetical protein